MNTSDIARQENHLAGEIAQGFYDDFWAKDDFRYDRDDFDLIGEEAAGLLGRGNDDPYLILLRRRHDGQLFEVEIEVTVWAREEVPQDGETAPPAGPPPRKPKRRPAPTSRRRNDHQSRRHSRTQPADR